MPKHTMTLAGLVALSAAVPLTATAAGDVIDLDTWDQEKLYSGWSAERLLDTDVKGEEGEEIGEVENIIVGSDVKVQAIIVEAKGFLDIGDTHFRVPWDQVKMESGMESVTVPIKEENIDDFSLFGDEVVTDPQSWRVTQLMDDFVTLEGEVNYGMVDDLIFSKDGELKSVIVIPDVTYDTGEPYAYPYYGYDYDFEPGLDTYALPYARDDIADLEPFDYDKLEVELEGESGQQEQTGQSEEAPQ